MNHITIIRNDSEIGTFTLETLKAAYQAGIVNRTDLARPAKEQTAVPLHELFDLETWPTPNNQSLIKSKPKTSPSETTAIEKSDPTWIGDHVAPQPPPPAGKKIDNRLVTGSLFIAAAILIIALQYFFKPAPDLDATAGVTESEMTPGQRYAAAKNYYDSANRLFNESKGIFNDDEQGITRAQTRYQEAWQVLHGVPHAEGEAWAVDTPNARVLSADLQSALTRCQKELD